MGLFGVPVIDVYDPKHPDAPPIKAFASNIPAGYVPVSQSTPTPAAQQDKPAAKADTTPHTATKSKE